MTERTDDFKCAKCNTYLFSRYRPTLEELSAKHYCASCKPGPAKTKRAGARSCGRARGDSGGDGMSDWISVHDRVPEVGQEVLVYGQSPWEKSPSIKVDRWDEIHEAPVSFSSATMYVGDGWTENDSDGITHWMPLPKPPEGGA